MQHRPGSTHGPGERLLLAAVALALLGLLSMHGWGSHVGVHPQQPAEAAVASEAVSEAGAAASGHHAGGDLAPHPNDPSGPADTGHSGAAMGLCLAVLTALLLGAALARRDRALPVPAWRRPAWRAPVLLPRAADPPDLVRLCVSRC